MDAAWLNAAIPDAPPVILGLRLRPYTLGHELLLHKVESPFVAGTEFGFADLAIAVLICSQDFHAARRSISSRWLNFFLWAWKLRMRRCNAFVDAGRFQEYRAAGRWFPEIEIPVTDAKSLTQPPEFRLASELMSKVHLSWDACMDFPLNRAHALFVALGEAKGEIKTFHEEELEAVARMRAEVAEEGENAWAF